MEVIHVSKNHALDLKNLKNRNKPLENSNRQEVSSVKKCLFGVPDCEDIENLLRDQIQEDWERIKMRFGIDIEDIENMETARGIDVHTPRKRKLNNECKAKRTPKRRRLFLQPHNVERKITDFYQVRKATTAPHLDDKKDS